MSKTILLRPRLNEKTYGLAESRVYVFDVDRAVNKHTIARAVEAQFEVKVNAVNTTNIPGKSKRVISITGKRVKNAEGSRNDFKKAYVTLAEGHGLPFFNAIEEEETKEQAAQEKFDKAAAKQAAKDEKAAAKTNKTKKPTDKVSKAAKPAADLPAKPTANSDGKASGKIETQGDQPAATNKLHIPAWRGFRLRKKKDEDK